MMQDVKYALAFLAGTLYTSAWWSRALLDADDPRTTLPVIVVIFGTVGIVSAIIIELFEHWND